ncbi:MAG: ABC transporter ATP-binding protein [Candidatus Aminicenantes bacterium]|nr:ABC transporter ATP-binding protein [Candidatus Aminicenantes bacterium]
MSELEKIVTTDRLTKVYSLGKIQVVALNEVSLSIEKGSFYGISGQSGSGKSTVLNLLGGLDTPTSGTIEVEGRRISQMNGEELARYRRKGTGMIFQSFNLIPSYTAMENVGLPLLFSGVPKKERGQRALDILKIVGLQHRSSHRPSELSGGEQQRVSIARALINSPRILLADEPTGNLDSKTSKEIVTVLSELNVDHGVTVIMVSHEEALLKEFASEVICLQDGKVTGEDKLR